MDINLHDWVRFHAPFLITITQTEFCSCS